MFKHFQFWLCYHQWQYVFTICKTSAIFCRCDDAFKLHKLTLQQTTRVIAIRVILEMENGADPLTHAKPTTGDAPLIRLCATTLDQARFVSAGIYICMPFEQQRFSWFPIQDIFGNYQMNTYFTFVVFYMAKCWTLFTLFFSRCVSARPDTRT